MFCAIIFQLLFQLYYLVVMAKSESFIRNQSFMLFTSMSIATVLACTQMILKFNGETKSLGRP